jgi:hypothetical protein
MYTVILYRYQISKAVSRRNIYYYSEPEIINVDAELSSPM